jgi:ABC-type bacteriocin/lantibiotic exporter with double-glycine peptidase domain
MRLEQACRASELHDSICAQPGGYEIQVGEAELALSGGQAHRFAVLRALLKNALILVLDEVRAFPLKLP